MWLCTQHGFYSIVRKAEGDRHLWHVRARMRGDLENLQALVWPQRRMQIHDSPAADYRWRIILDSELDLHDLFRALASHLDYSNFKGRIAAAPDQQHKLSAYHDFWGDGRRWQMIELTAAVNNLVNTSVDDCRSSLWHQTDAEVLRAALAECEDRGMKTKCEIIRRRIRLLERLE